MHQFTTLPYNFKKSIKRVKLRVSPKARVCTVGSWRVSDKIICRLTPCNSSVLGFDFEFVGCCYKALFSKFLFLFIGKVKGLIHLCVFVSRIFLRILYITVEFCGCTAVALLTSAKCRRGNQCCRQSKAKPRFLFVNHRIFPPCFYLSMIFWFKPNYNK